MVTKNYLQELQYTMATYTVIGHLMILSHEFPTSLFMVSRLHLQSYFCDLSDVFPRVKAVSTFSFSKKRAGFFSDISESLLFTLCVEHYTDCCVGRVGCSKSC